MNIFSTIFFKIFIIELIILYIIIFSHTILNELYASNPV